MPRTMRYCIVAGHSRTKDRESAGVRIGSFLMRQNFNLHELIDTLNKYVGRI